MEKFNQQMEDLKKKQEVMRKKLEEMKSAKNTEAWKKLKTEKDTAMEDLNELFDKMISNFHRT